jgi:uncharacterized protein YndB with AHSA1/START domain/DNA-binding transcriptional ArsR family regulator
VDVALFTALAEPNRLRIVELLNEHPCSVGEVAATLGLRQPQVTKHLHTLARAGLVTVHPLGQRRIYALERERLRALRGWLDGFDADHPSEDVLEQYCRAIEAERAQAERDPGWAEGRVLSLSRSLPTSASVLWRYWTSAQLVREWWAPEHFTVADCELDAVAGGRLRIVMQEADGSRHAASGRFLSLDAPRTLSFELAALGPDGEPLLWATYALALDERANGTDLSLDVRITSSTGAAAPAVAGMRLGWEQCLSKLARAIARSAHTNATAPDARPRTHNETERSEHP